MKSTPAIVLAAAAAFASATAHAEDMMMLALSSNCLNCHAIDQPGDGPSFKAIADRYRGKAGAAEQLAKKILSGGSGVWGDKKMEPNEVSEAQARELAAWVLQTK